MAVAGATHLAPLVLKKLNTELEELAFVVLGLLSTYSMFEDDENRTFLDILISAERSPLNVKPRYGRLFPDRNCSSGGEYTVATLLSKIIIRYIILQGD